MCGGVDGNGGSILWLKLAPSGNQLPCLSLRNRLGAMAHTHFAVDIGDMAFYCPQADDQSIGDLLVGKAIDDELEHFKLPLGERFRQQGRAVNGVHHAFLLRCG